MNTLECPNTETIQRILLGCSEDVEINDFEAHLSECESCRTACHSLAATDELTVALHAADSLENSHPELPEQIAHLLPRLQQLDVRFTAQSQEPDGIDVRILLAPAIEADEIGRFAGYRVSKFLGQGGMGLVFAAEDPVLKRQVALKILNPVLAASRVACRRFERETQAAAAFEHDHIITIYHVGEEAGLPFMAMQLLEGESLQDRLDRQGKLTAKETQRIGRQIADGLAVAHGRGLLHRDIKPDNIWLQAGTDRVKILDFGLVQLTENESRLTDVGTVIGTPAYMAPEQAQGTETDERCDLFSLGSLMYRCVTGITPFRRDSAVATLVAVTEQNVPSAEEVCDCPAELSNTILNLMQKNVQDRPASARAVVDLLEPVSKQTAAEPVSQKPQRQSQPGIPSRINTAIVAIFAGAAAFALAVIIQIETDQGTLKVVTEGDQFATTVQGQTLVIREVSTGKELKVTAGENSIASGEYEFQVQSLPDGIKFSTPRFSIFRGQKKQVDVSFVPHKPDPASPLDLNRADSNIKDAPQQEAEAMTGLQAAEAPNVTPVDSDTTPTIIVNGPVPKYSPNTPLGPGALVTKPMTLPRVSSWTVEPKHDCVNISGPHLSHDGKWIAAAGREGSIRVWKTNDLSTPLVLYGHQTSVRELEWSPNGKFLATANQSNKSETAQIQIRRTTDFKSTDQISTPASLLSWSHGGNQLSFLSWSDDRDLRFLNVYDMNSGWTGHQSIESPVLKRGAPSPKMQWSPNDESIALAFGETVRCFDAGSLALNHTLNVEAIDFRWQSNGQQIVVQTKPKSDVTLSRGKDSKDVITPLRFETWDVGSQSPTDKTYDEVVFGNHTVLWDKDGTPIVTKWPKVLPESDEQKPDPTIENNITLSWIGKDQERLIPHPPGRSLAISGLLKLSADQQKIACLTADGLYYQNLAASKQWRWVSKAQNAHQLTPTLAINDDSLWFAKHKYALQGWRQSSFLTHRVNPGNLKMVTTSTPDFLMPNQALSPDGKILAEIRWRPEREPDEQWVLEITNQQEVDAQPQIFPLAKSEHQNIDKKLVRLRWAGDSQTLALIPEDQSLLPKKHLTLFNRTRENKFEPVEVRSGPRYPTQSAFKWNPNGASFAWATDKGPAIFHTDLSVDAIPLPLDSEFKTPKMWNYFGRLEFECFYWIDDKTLFGGVVQKQQHGSLDRKMAYLWSQDENKTWQIKFKFVGNAFENSFLSPDKTRVAYAEPDQIKAHVANLKTGLIHTHPIDVDWQLTHRKPLALGWFDNQKLIVTSNSRGYHHVGTLNLESGETKWLQKFGASAVAKNGFYLTPRYDLEFYNPDLELQSTIVISSKDRALKVFPDGRFKVNTDDPCELVFVVKFDDGTQQTLTPHEFEDRFRNEFPTDFEGVTTHQARNTLNLTVVGTDGKPIENARVFRNHVYTPISDQSEKKRIENAIVRTDNQGRTEIKLSGTPHDLRLWVSAPDHLTMHSMWAKDLDPDGGEVPEAFTVILSKAQTIGGIVRDKNGRPLPDAEVKIRVTGESWDSNKQTPVARPIRLSQTAIAITDKDGRWTCQCAPSVSLRQTEEQRETEREKTQDYRIKVTATSEVAEKKTSASQKFELQTLLDQKAELQFSDKKITSPFGPHQ